MAKCKAVMALGDVRFDCDEPHPHRGRAHRNKVAGAYWCSHGEALAAKRKEAASDVAG